MSALGIYIHIPYCISKCPYCDFFSHCGSDEEKDAYTDALIRDIKSFKGKGLCADTVYFGGGTPPLLGADNLCRVLEAVYDSFSLGGESEITVEANPADELYGFFSQMKRNGVNRLSMGMQSGIDGELKALGRRHGVSDVQKSVEWARRAGIDNISLDLMLAIPGQTKSTLDKSIDLAASLLPEHLSAYLLIIEEGTPFYENTPVVPDDDRAAAMYLQTVKRLESLGYGQYEISNFAKHGRESRHNLKYWHDEEYLGFGASAHGFFGGERFYYPCDIKAYIAGKPPVNDGKGGDREEYAMLALRLAEGITEKGWQERFCENIPTLYRRNAALPEMRGLVEADADGIRLTKRGFLLSNTAISTIIG